MKKHQLLHIDWPDFGEAAFPNPIELTEFETRIANTRQVMQTRGLTHLIVFADREHFANLQYLTNFDPRFEEALLVLDLHQKPLLLTGNECEARLPVSPLYEAGQLRTERYQPFSLLDQPRERSRPLLTIFKEEGIGPSSTAGCVGWKYFSDKEHADAIHAIDIPAFIVDTLRNLAGFDKVVNATDIFMHPGYGLRTFCSAAEIAFFEYSNVLASEGMKRVVFGLHDGVLDFDLARLYHYNGLPLNCHITLTTQDNMHLGLSGPNGTRVRLGEPFATNLGYWGSNICRAGWVVHHEQELPAPARDYVPAFAGPYFEAMAEWFSNLGIGTPGGRLFEIIEKRLPYDRFGIYLNPGHLIHLDEWVSSPVYKGSDIAIHSGMYLQTDVIPFSKNYFSTRMEDGVVIADESLRKELQTRFPDCYRRCLSRHAFMTDVLGIDLPREVLPLSNIPAIVPPYLLSPEWVLAMRG